MKTQVGGPDRPIPEKIVRDKTRLAAEDTADGGTKSTAAGLAASAAAVQETLYNKLSGVLGERGCVLSLNMAARACF